MLTLKKRIALHLPYKSESQDPVEVFHIFQLENDREVKNNTKMFLLY